MQAADFWDNQEKAQRTVAELKRTKAQIDPVAKVVEALGDAKVAYELAKEAGDNALLTEADESLHAIEQRMEKVELLSLLSGKHDHRDCYFTISAGDGGTEANDWADMLLRALASSKSA